MSTKYLNDSGLAYFWTKIKAWCAAAFAPLVHSHAWSSITGKPDSFPPSGHSHGNVTNGGELGTASRAVVTDANKKITVSSVTSTELGYLSGVTSSVQTQLDGKASVSDIPSIPSLSLTVSGSGNAVTALSVSGHAITATKGSTFLTSHQDLSNYVTLNSAQTITDEKTFSNTVNFINGSTVVDGTETIQLYGKMGNNDYWAIRAGATASDAGFLEICSGDNGTEPIYFRQRTSSAIIRTLTLLDASGNSAFPGTITATSFIGDLTGNATTVTGTAGTSTLAWNSEVTLYTVGGNAIKAKLPANPNTNTTYTIATGDSNGQIKVTPSSGSAYNVAVKGLGTAAYTASTDYAAASHTHSYLPLSGGNLTGVVNNSSYFTANGYYTKNASVTKGTNPASGTTYYWTFGAEDKNGISYANNCMGMLETSLTSDGIVRTYIRAMENTASSSNNVQLTCLYDKANSRKYVESNGEIKITAPSQNQLRLIQGNYGVLFRNDGSTFYILLTDSGSATHGSWNSFRPLAINLSTGVCNINGNAATATKATQDGSGNTITSTYAKLSGATFTGKVVMQGYLRSTRSDPGVELDVSGYTKGAALSTQTNAGVFIHDKSADNAETSRLACLYSHVLTDKSTVIGLAAYKNVANSTDCRTLFVTCDTSGNGYAYCPNPSNTTENSTMIATTHWVRIATGNTALNAATATKLATARTLYAALGSVYDSSNPVQFDGSAAKALPISGTLAIAHGGTGATTRLNAIKALTNENVGTNATHLLGLKSDWSKVGYVGLSDVKSVLGLGSAAYTNSSAYAAASHTHSYLPLSGGNMTGNIVYDTTNTVGIRKNNATSLLEVSGGSALNKGARLALYGESHSSMAGRFDLIAANSSTSKSLVGTTDTLKWNGAVIQTSSDARLKTPLASVPDEVLDAWEDVDWGQFQYNEAIERHGEDARLHLGLIAQSVDAAFYERGLDACHYGILCYDMDDDLWMVRYAEALAMEASYQRRENARLRKRVADLEDRLAALELRLGSE